MKKAKTSIPWQVAKNKIEEYTTSKWKHKWISAPQYKHTKLFYDSPSQKQIKIHSENGHIHAEYMDQKHNRT